MAGEKKYPEKDEIDFRSGVVITRELVSNEIEEARKLIFKDVSDQLKRPSMQRITQLILQRGAEEILKGISR